MSEGASPRIVVVGVGNPDAGDDAAGPLVARAVASRVPAGVRVLEVHGDVTSIMSAWEGADVVVVVDAVVSGAPVGTVRSIDAWRSSVPRQPASTHGFGVPEAIELARALGTLPPRLTVVAVEGASFEIGAGLSEGVAGGVEEAAARVLAAITGRPHQTG